MSSLALIIRSGLIWSAEPPSSVSTTPLPKEQFSPFNEAQRKELHELCVERFPIANPFVKNKSLSIGINAIDSALPSQGLSGGSIHEWGLAREHGEQTPRALFSWFAFRAWKEITRNSEKFIFWIGRESWPSPHTLAQICRDDNVASFFSKNIFIDIAGEKERLWAIETALRSPAAALVIAPLSTTSLAISRRFLLAAERGASIGLFAISPQMQHITSGAQSRWEVTPIPSSSDHPRWRIEIKKWKGAQPEQRSWEVELSAPSIEELYFAPTTLNNSEQHFRTNPRKSHIPRENHEHTISPEAFSLRIPADVVDRSLQKKASLNDARSTAEQIRRSG